MKIFASLTGLLCIIMTVACDLILADFEDIDVALSIVLISALIRS